VPAGAVYAFNHYYVEGDASGASYLWALAALSQGNITVRNISFASLQGDAQFPRLLERMGCVVTEGREEDLPYITVTGTPRLQGIEADMTLMPDTAQTLAAVAACARGNTVITGLSTLRHKETDRIAAVHI